MVEDTGEGFEETTTSVGERLRAAREAQGITLEDVAARTRIPTRHLQSLEASEWNRLPAVTYSIGFAKSYASAVGLDRTEIGESLRAEMGGFANRPTMSPEVFEPVDPARVMPRWLVVAAVLAVLAVVAALLFMRQQSLQGVDEPAPPATVEQPAAQDTAPNTAPVPPAAAPAASGPVTVTASEPAWIQIYEKGGRTLFQGELAAGQSYTVPADSAAPLLKTGKPEALRVAVGTTAAPAVGQPGVTARDVSLLGADLMRGGAATPSAPPPTAQP